ncbi:MAG TPA: type II toxin-antitoxin system VapC family toxin [Anaerolineales bacterium]|nr:type II toxin-antitoxin system VapC family toxin [Anaerolineales bacterium]
MSKGDLRQCVIDANVALKLFIEQPGSDQADALFARLGTDALARFYAPDLLFAEVASVLAKYVGLRMMTAVAARKSVKELVGLGLVSIPTAELVPEALEIAVKHQVSGYDACYVVLSARLSMPFVTADERLFNGLAGRGYDLRLLSRLGLNA